MGVGAGASLCAVCMFGKGVFVYVVSVCVFRECTCHFSHCVFVF